MKRTPNTKPETPVFIGKLLDSLPPIESSIPVPSRSKWKSLMDQMKPGDSVLVSRNNAIYLSSKAKKMGVKTTMRTIIAPDQVRLWRIA